MFKDLKELLSVFNAHSVRYLIVGGYAVSFHAQPRATKDLDLFIQSDLTNACAAHSALVEFGAPLDGIAPADLTDTHTFLRFGREPLAVDILSGIDGVDFGEAWERRVVGLVDAESGLEANFISKEDLIASKLAAGRLRDLADVEEIRESASAQDGPLQDGSQS